MTMPTLTAEPATLGKSEPSAKSSLIGLSRAELAARMAALGVPERQTRMRARQLWSWLYVRGETDFFAMTDIAKDLRAELAANFTLARPDNRDRAGLASTAPANGCSALPTARRSRRSISPRRIAARSASRARSAAR